VESASDACGDLPHHHPQHRLVVVHCYPVLALIQWEKWVNTFKPKCTQVEFIDENIDRLNPQPKADFPVPQYLFAIC
jgi:hypothetical protein